MKKEWRTLPIFEKRVQYCILPIADECNVSWKKKYAYILRKVDANANLISESLNYHSFAFHDLRIHFKVA